MHASARLLVSGACVHDCLKLTGGILSLKSLFCMPVMGTCRGHGGGGGVFLLGVELVPVLGLTP